ncbi:MAG: flagellar hook-basal body complex protein FliE [Armatimonadia bacterium]
MPFLKAMLINSFQPAQLVTPGELPSASRLPVSWPETGSTSLIQPGMPAAQQPLADGSPPEFSQVLGKELERVNDLLGEADVQAQRVATGDAENLHESMLAMAEADLALQVTMRVTQKAIAVYQEISRMQV